MTPFPKPIYVTRPLLPPLEDFASRLRDVWDSQWLTNGGAQHERLERQLESFLGVRHVSLFANGTLALLTVLRALKLKGSVVTTPFTFPATAHVLEWSGLEPVFCDIDPITLTIDPAAAEVAVQTNSSAILGVHVYGLSCDVSRLQALAHQRGLKLIFDGAHAFGTTVDGRGVGQFGDATMYSFHATKLFHTAEGGALACPSPELKAAVDHLKNFGILNQEEVGEPGINGKMNELQAALGLAVLDHVDDEIAARRVVAARYRHELAGIDGLTCLAEPADQQSACQYFVVRVDPHAFGASRDDVHAYLTSLNVMTRKYFFPLCSDYACYRHLPSAAPEGLPVARRVAREVLCLPIYGTLPLDSVSRICDMLRAVPRR